MFSRCTLFLVLLTSITGCGNRTQTVDTTDSDVSEPESSFSIEDSNGKTLIDASDIKSYDWDTHTITLRPGLRDELHTQLAGTLVGGQPFTVIANGKPSYNGSFTTSLSSSSLHSIIINLFPSPDLKKDQIQISLGYPNEDVYDGDDLRQNEAVKDALKSLGKVH